MRIAIIAMVALAVLAAHIAPSFACPERLRPLRYSFLLSGAMSRRHVGRTTPPAFGSFL